VRKTDRERHRVHVDGHHWEIDVSGVHGMARCAIFAAILSSSAASGQQLRVPHDRLRANSDTVRIQAFYSLVTAADAHSTQRLSVLAARAKAQPELGDALLALLDRENEVISHASRGSLSGDYLGSYYVDLAVTVARMGDRRSAAALTHALGSSVVRNAMAGFGNDAVLPLISAFESHDRDENSGAVLTVERILAEQSSLHLTAANVAALKDALLGIVEGRKDAFTRMSAVNAMEPLDGAEIRIIMLRIATSDTATGYASPGHARPLPVRIAAQRWLAAHP
jgi:hypothetical protein